MTATYHPPGTDPVGTGAARPRVLILECDATLLARLMTAVDADPGLELVTVTGDTSALLGLVAKMRPEVALVNSRPDEGGGSELVRRLRNAHPEIACIALWQGPQERELAEMLEAGAIASIDPTASESAIAEAIRGLIGSTAPLDDEPTEQPPADLRRQTARGEGSPLNQSTPVGEVRQPPEKPEFGMVFQAIVDLQGGQVVGQEALAQTGGLRGELEIELLREAVAQARRLPSGGFVSVNLSPAAAMSGNLVDVIPPSLLSRVVIELTDLLDVQDYQPLAEALAGLRTAGLRVAVDDSGRGLASLQRVTRLEPDFIKLNRSLTRDIDRDETRRTLAVALTTVAAQIGAAVVAEGIETAAELDALRSLGIPYGQGYLVGRPEPLPEEPAPAVALPSAAEEPPPVVLPGRALGSLRDGSRVVFDLLESELPGSRCWVSHLDYEQRRFRVVCSSRGFRPQLPPGFSAALQEWPCFYMASGHGSRLCGDTASDPTYGALGLLRELEVVSYAGVPLELENGQQLGSLALVSRATDGYDEKTLALLRAVSARLARALENEVLETGASSPTVHIRHLASTDWLTGVLNRPSFLERLEQEAVQGPRRGQASYLFQLVPDSFDALAERYGRAVAELVVKDIADALARAAEGVDAIGRISKTEFAVLLRKRTAPKAATYFRRKVRAHLREAFAKRNISLAARAGLVQLEGQSPEQAFDAVRAASRTLL